MNLLRQLTFLLGSLTVNHTVLLFWISFFLLSISLAFPWSGNLFIILLSQFLLTFLQTQERDAPFYHTACDYSCADWDDLFDHLRDVPLDDIFEFSASAAASYFCEWNFARIDVYIPHHKHFELHSCLWFSAVFATSIAHSICLHQQHKSSASLVNFW